MKLRLMTEDGAVILKRREPRGLCESCSNRGWIITKSGDGVRVECCNVCDAIDSDEIAELVAAPIAMLAPSLYEQLVQCHTLLVEVAHDSERASQIINRNKEMFKFMKTLKDESKEIFDEISRIRKENRDSEEKAEDFAEEFFNGDSLI